MKGGIPLLAHLRVLDPVGWASHTAEASETGTTRSLIASAIKPVVNFDDGTYRWQDCIPASERQLERAIRQRRTSCYRATGGPSFSSDTTWCRDDTAQRPLECFVHKVICRRMPEWLFWVRRARGLSGGPFKAITSAWTGYPMEMADD